MDVTYTHCAGLDVHKKTVVACAITPGAQGAKQVEIRTFGTMTADLLALSDWLQARGVRQVAMESTGEFWVRRESRIEDCSIRIKSLGRSLPFYR